MIIAGLGFASAVSAETLVGVVRRAQAELGQRAEALAVPDFKSQAPSLLAAARVLGLRILLVDRAGLTLAQPRCETFSSHAQTATGLGSIAEACALAAAGAHSYLFLARITQGLATCALAGPGA